MFLKISQSAKSLVLNASIDNKSDDITSTLRPIKDVQQQNIPRVNDFAYAASNEQASENSHHIPHKYSFLSPSHFQLLHLSCSRFHPISKNNQTFHHYFPLN